MVKWLRVNTVALVKPLRIFLFGCTNVSSYSFCSFKFQCQVFLLIDSAQGKLSAQDKHIPSSYFRYLCYFIISSSERGSYLPSLLSKITVPSSSTSSECH